MESRLQPAELTRLSKRSNSNTIRLVNAHRLKPGLHTRRFCPEALKFSGTSLRSAVHA
jgi:hypothetical protein